MKNALIFGVTGQDGSYLAQFLLKKGYNVFGTFRRTSHKCFERIEELQIFEDVSKIKCDLADDSSIRAAIKQSKPDEIYNLAAQSFVGASFQQPILTSDVTGLGTLRVLNAIREIAPDTRFYQASSSEMFGNYPGKKDETSVFKPRSPYGAAKVFAHHMTNHYREAYDLFACCGILFNHESPLRGIEFVTRQITYRLARIKYDKQQTFSLGNIHARRDWGFAGDYVEAMYKMVQQENPNDYVVCTGVQHTIRELLSYAFETAEISDWERYIESDPRFKRPAEVHALHGSYAKAKEILGWEPKTEFKDMVALMVKEDIKRLSNDIR